MQKNLCIVGTIYTYMNITHSVIEFVDRTSCILKSESEHNRACSTITKMQWHGVDGVYVCALVLSTGNPSLRVVTRTSARTRWGTALIRVNDSQRRIWILLTVESTLDKNTEMTTEATIIRFYFTKESVETARVCTVSFKSDVNNSK